MPFFLTLQKIFSASVEYPDVGYISAYKDDDRESNHTTFLQSNCFPIKIQGNERQLSTLRHIYEYFEIFIAFEILYIEISNKTQFFLDFFEMFQSAFPH